MPVNKPHITESGVYFITFTCYKWLRLFEITNSYDLVYKWFGYLKEKGHYIAGYVIMPNHIHLLIGFMPSGPSINTIVGNGKRFMAYEIVSRLKDAKLNEILAILSAGVDSSDKKRGKHHEVFEQSFDIKACHSFKFVNQKLNYIHCNPVSKKWELVKYAGDYIHSSAGYYESGKPGLFEVFNIADLIQLQWFEKYRVS